MTKRLHYFLFDVFRFFKSCEVWEDGSFAKARDKTDVLSWFLCEWLKSHLISCANTSEIVVQPRSASTTHEKEPRVILDGRKIIVQIPAKCPERDSVLLQDTVFFEYLFQLAEKAFEVLKISDCSEIAEFRMAFLDFESQGYSFERILVRKKLPGSKVIARIVQYVDTRAAASRLELMEKDQVLYSEIISQAAPFAFIFKGKMRQLDFQDGILSIEGTIPTSIAPEALNRTSHGDFTEKTKVLGHYYWKRPMSDMLD